MKQQDFQGRSGAFAPRRQPAQQQAFAPQPMAFPQPTMQGGNYAPQPLQFGQTNMDYQKLLNEYNSTNKNIRNLVDENDAIANMDQMTDMVEKINRMDGVDDVVDVGSIDKLGMMINQVVTNLRNPKLWLPESRASYADKLVVPGTKIADALEKFGAQIVKLKV